MTSAFSLMKTILCLSVLLCCLSFFSPTWTEAQTPYTCSACNISVCASAPTGVVTIYVTPYLGLTSTQVCSSINQGLVELLPQFTQGSNCSSVFFANTCYMYAGLVQSGALSPAQCVAEGGVDYIDGVTAFYTNYTRIQNLDRSYDVDRLSMGANAITCLAAPYNTSLRALGYATEPLKALTIFGSGYTTSNATLPGAPCIPCHIGSCDQYGYNIDVYLGSYANLSAAQVCQIAQVTTVNRLTDLNANLPNASLCRTNSILRQVCGVWLEIATFVTDPATCGLNAIDFAVQDLDSYYTADCYQELGCLTTPIANQLAAADFCQVPAQALATYGASVLGLTIESGTQNCYSCPVPFCGVDIQVSAPNASSAALLCADTNADIRIFEAHTVSSVCQANLSTLVCGGLALISETEYGCDVSTIGQGTVYANTTAFTQGCYALASTCLDNVVGPALTQSGACLGYSQFLSAITGFASLASSSSGGNTSSAGNGGNGVSSSAGGKSAGGGNGVSEAYTVYGTTNAVVALMTVFLIYVSMKAQAQQ